MEYYLTDTVFLKGDTMYHETDKGVKEVKKHNWHHVLAEYGWTKMPKKWILILNKVVENPSLREKNSLYGVLDCEHDGDCFFHCIANSLNERDEYAQMYDSGDIRTMIGDSLTQETFDTLIGYYRAMTDASDFDEEWDPHQITSLTQFREILVAGGHDYWGDHLILNLLVQCLQTNILILNSNDYTDNYTVYNTMNDYDESKDTICLLYENEMHFQLIGHFDGSRMVSYFRAGTLPHEMCRIHCIAR